MDKIKKQNIKKKMREIYIKLILYWFSINLTHGTKLNENTEDK